MHFAYIQTILALYFAAIDRSVCALTTLQYKLTTLLSKASDTALPSRNAGILYVVATPIGNLGDISGRAIDTLKNVSLILAEDTRHSKRLLNHYGISTPLKACHEHNEDGLVDWIKSQLQAGENLALISDAGTPLISDPGFVVVRALRRDGCDIQTVPGPSSIIAALSIAGLPTDSFIYEGFLPAKTTARQGHLIQYRSEHRTIVTLESSHRIIASITDIVEILGGDRIITLARELTKKFETVLGGPASEVLAILQQDSNQTKGEFVLMIAGVAAHEKSAEADPELQALMVTLMQELPLKQAVSLAVKLTGARKNEVYQLALALQDSDD